MSNFEYTLVSFISYIDRSRLFNPFTSIYGSSLKIAKLVKLLLQRFSRLRVVELSFT